MAMRLTEEQLDWLCARLPEPPPRPKGGRPPMDRRKVIAAIFWVLDNGATILNDVWGLQRDPDMARLAAERGVPIVVMHNRAEVDPAIDIVADASPRQSALRTYRGRHRRPVRAQMVSRLPRRDDRHARGDVAVAVIRW